MFKSVPAYKRISIFLLVVPSGLCGQVQLVWSGFGFRYQHLWRATPPGWCWTPAESVVLVSESLPAIGPWSTQRPRTSEPWLGNLPGARSSGATNGPCDQMAHRQHSGFKLERQQEKAHLALSALALAKYGHGADVFVLLAYLAPRQTSIWNLPSLPMFLDVLLMARMKRQKWCTLVCQFSSAVTSRCSALSK